MAAPDIQAIIDDLYALDPSLKTYAHKLRPLIEDILQNIPDSPFDQNIQTRIYESLQSHIETAKKEKYSRWNSLADLSLHRRRGGVAIAGIAGIALFVYTIQTPETPKELVAITPKTLPTPETSENIVKRETGNVKQNNVYRASGNMKRETKTSLRDTTDTESGTTITAEKPILAISRSDTQGGDSTTATESAPMLMMMKTAAPTSALTEKDLIQKANDFLQSKKISTEEYASPYSKSSSSEITKLKYPHKTDDTQRLEVTLSTDAGIVQLIQTQNGTLYKIP